MKKLDTKIIIISGFLISLNIVLSRIVAIPGIIKFGGFLIIFGGLVFGPVVGGIIGTIGDIVSHIVRPTGLFMPHFVLTSALTGIIPAIVVRSLKIDLAKLSSWKIIVSIFVGQMITTVVMVPYFLNTLFNIPLAVS
ncbi:conserved hypothetical protein [Alkaliphilus metalliredigens QYMF]|uniref:Signal transduction histidine kinase, LytS n=1 Tax=Alkaliphilus metalliredigens (strain QYMF) TaxID=293826 RepID=A6TX65_ALKMQ|nr:folate family ECF transporter S component [Alkaliphilus metalliredigens]ABR50783.1 conserved hypothetical protein [Alkaliphilus metalliredigens QYMF]